MSRFFRIIINIVFVAIVALILGYAIYYAWLYLSADRQLLAQTYLVQAEEKIEEGQAAGMWELSKAYMLGGVDKSSYEMKEGVFLAKLGDKRAEEMLSGLIERGVVNDDVWYEFGLILMKNKEYERAEYVFTQMSEGVKNDIKKDVLANLAYIEGTKRNWEAVGQYLEKAGEMADQNELYEKLNGAYSLIEGEMEIGFLTDEEKKELDNLRGDLLVMKVADILIDKGLCDWARGLLNDLYYQTEDKIDVNLLFAKSYLAERDCKMVAKVLVELKKLDGNSERSEQVESDLLRCW